MSTTDTTVNQSDDASPTARPTALAPILDNLPDRLTEGTDFVVWDWWWDAKRRKWTKPPLSATSGYRTAINNPANGVTCEAAISAMHRRHHDGIGRMLFRGHHLVGFDLDGCRNPATGEIAPWAQDVVDGLNSYTEVSPSGTGLRILADGELSESGNKTGDLEVYCDGRYLTLTGQHLPGTPQTVEPRQAQIDAIHGRYFAPTISAPKTPKVRRASDPNVDNIQVNLTGTDTEPPVILSPSALAVWRGERPVLKSNGETDRSRSLYEIGVVLHEHGATRPTIIAALAERDTALDWNRYSDVPHEYGRIAAKVAPKPRLVGPIGTPAPTSTNTDTCPVQLAQVRAELAEKNLIISGLFQTVLNPNLTLAKKIAFLSILATTEKKRQDGDVLDNGTVEVTTSDVSNDWRPTPDKGESVAPTNNDGSKPRMSRDKVKPAIQSLVACGLLPATPRKVLQTRANGTRYNDEVWDVTPTNMAESLALAATWQSEEPTPRKPRTSRATCPHCNELHPIQRQDTCTGCGTIRATTIIQPDLEADTSDTIADTAPATAEPNHLRKISGQLVNTRPVVVGESHVRKISGHEQATANPIPGFALTPLDRYTDVANRAKP